MINSRYLVFEVSEAVFQRSSRLEVFRTKRIKNFAKFTVKHLCYSLFFNKVADLRPSTLLKKRRWHRCFHVDFAKFLRPPFFTEHLQWLLLQFNSHHTKEIFYYVNTNFMGNRPWRKSKYFLLFFNVKTCFFNVQLKLLRNKG